jgi:spore cortex formation protein SpoVR/YcgB (stage V sporulation)
MSLFEKAAKQKLRFNSSKGQLTVEDLFDLSLTSLDNIAKAVNRKLKDEVEESFIQKKSTASAELELQLDILKYIIEYKTSVEEANKKRAETVARKHQIEEILMRKKSQELEDLSVDELQAMLNG